MKRNVRGLKLLEEDQPANRCRMSGRDRNYMLCRMMSLTENILSHSSCEIEYFRYFIQRPLALHLSSAAPPPSDPSSFTSAAMRYSRYSYIHLSLLMCTC